STSLARGVAAQGDICESRGSQIIVNRPAITRRCIGAEGDTCEVQGAAKTQNGSAVIRRRVAGKGGIANGCGPLVIKCSCKPRRVVAVEDGVTHTDRRGCRDVNSATIFSCRVITEGAA